MCALRWCQRCITWFRGRERRSRRRGIPKTMFTYLTIFFIGLNNYWGRKKNSTDQAYWISLCEVASCFSQTAFFVV